MHVAQIGNFAPPNSTENDLRIALKNLGCQVMPIQEGEASQLLTLIDMLTHGPRPDLILWTRTRDLAAKIGNAGWWELIAKARKADVPIVGYHLDRWWGLKRQGEVAGDPFFHVDMLCTADGAHDDEWRKLGIDHHWFPPAVSIENCGIGTPREEFTSDIAFVGSWQGYHPEWKHRGELVSWLQRIYGKRVAFWPKPGQHAVRGADLRDLYASVRVVVGDSCLVKTTSGQPMNRYVSDRLPETLGRNGALVHPYVDGVTDVLFRHASWQLGDWKGLRKMIDATLENPDSARDLENVSSNHTYNNRMGQLLNRLGLEVTS